MPTPAALDALPDPIPQHTWIAYQMIDKGSGWSILDKRVYHSAAQVAGGIAGNWISVVAQRDRRGVSTRSVLVYYGVAGAVVEPIEQLAELMVDVEPFDDLKALKKQIVKVIESWRR